MEQVEKRHPFSYTLGLGPYKWVGSFNLGAAMSALQSGNVSGYNNAMQSAPKVESGMGTCSHCGMAIMIIQIVQTGEGKRFGVGSDCVLKVAAEGDFSNLSEMERQIRLEKRKRGQESRERTRQKKAQELGAMIESNKENLASMPHPNSYHAGKGKTMLDYCSFIFRNGYLSVGSVKILKQKLKELGLVDN